MLKKLNKKGTSLVELIAVIIIMGVIAAIAVPTTITIVNKNKQKAAVESANNAFESARVILQSATEADSLVLVGPATGSYYTSTTLLKDAGELTKWSANNEEIFFYYADSKFYALLAAPTADTTLPSFTSTDVTGYGEGTVPTFTVNENEVKWNGFDLKFIK